MILTPLVVVCFVFALIPAYFFMLNSFRFRRLLETSPNTDSLPSVSVLIPARNEESSIVYCVESVLASRDVVLEVIVLDDDSEDQTGRLVAELAARDSRVRLAVAPELPAGWCGKQHACAELAKLASYDVFVFLDADVRLASDSLRRMLGQFLRNPVDLLSGFPRQITGTLAERLLIPLIHFLLLGFLSLRRMRVSKRPAFAAGCGQLIMTQRKAYQQAGGHTTIRASLHDGLNLPRAYRSNGLTTDVFDATDIATCRMYRNASEVWNGLTKNATEGVASVGLIIPVTSMLLFGQVVPFVVLALVVCGGLSLDRTNWLLLCGTIAMSLLPRFIAAIRYRQSLVGAMMHPLSITLFLVIQWSAFLGSFSRTPVTWKGRQYQPDGD